MNRPRHPLQAWLDANCVSYEKAAQRCQRAGRKVAATYIEQIARGYYAPSYALAKFISSELTKGIVSVVALKEFPYTRASGEAA